MVVGWRGMEIGKRLVSLLRELHQARIVRPRAHATLKNSSAPFSRTLRPKVFRAVHFPYSTAVNQARCVTWCVQSPKGPSTVGRIPTTMQHPSVWMEKCTLSATR